MCLQVRPGDHHRVAMRRTCHNQRNNSVQAHAELTMTVTSLESC